MRKAILSVLLVTSAHSSMGNELNNLDTVWKSLSKNYKNLAVHRRYKTTANKLLEEFDLHGQKITIKFSNRWNHELDSMGGLFNDTEKGLLAKFQFNSKGILRKNRNLVRNNKLTKSYSAPLIEFKGKSIVLDPYIELAYDAEAGNYSQEDAWDLSSRPSLVSEWVEAQTIRGELLWKVRKKLLMEEINQNKDTNNHLVFNLIAKMKSLNMDKESIDIKCKKVEDFSKVDESKDWCFYSVSPLS